ncbi:MAG TPA: hypothetical protein VHM26_07335 [Chitinophagaceae bacterium]|jgi:hypothetical protein|nr:hypothetical protein [Chitinophagaceae bacterium]
MKKLLLLPAMLVTVALCAQKVINVDHNNTSNANVFGSFFTVAGVPFSSAKYVRITAGTPYFSETWMKGDLILDKDKVCRNAIVRLDLLDNSIEYIDPVTTTKMIASTPVKEMTLTDSITGEKFRFFHSSSLPDAKDLSPGWYQMLTDGTATLFKFVTKSITESRPYGSATVEQVIISADEYFLSTTTSFSKIKKFNSIPDMLPAKKDELKKYINSNKLYGKSEYDFSSVIEYYNTLLKAS